jgi:hypothetical protein
MNGLLHAVWLMIWGLFQQAKTQSGVLCGLSAPAGGLVHLLELQGSY